MPDPTDPAIVSALSGLAGVLVGAFITGAKEWWSSRLQAKKDIAYLGIRVTALLDEFVDACASAAADDGTSYGSPDEDGCYRPQTADPELVLHGLDVEWKALPSYLLYEVLGFPNQITDARRYLSRVSEFANPPYDDYMGERQYEYAKLGLKAHRLATKLRQLAGVPTREPLRWDAIAYMEEQVEKFENRKAARSADLGSGRDVL